MRKHPLFYLWVFGWLIFGATYIYAQLTLAPPWQAGVPNAATHTACTVAVGMTQMCLAADGLWLSVNGAPYVQVQTGTAVAGVTSISVNGSAPLSGAISLVIPSKAVTTSTTQLQ